MSFHNELSFILLIILLARDFLLSHQLTEQCIYSKRRGVTVYLTLLPMLQITAPSLLTFSLLFFIVTIQKKKLYFLPPPYPLPIPATTPTLCWFRDWDEGGRVFDWLRCWDVILCKSKCVGWLCGGNCLCAKEETLQWQCVMLGLLHRKLICLYFIPHFSSDEPALDSDCGWPSFTALCDSHSLIT